MTADLSPSAIQRGAADPMSSVWVEANAGSGKTKVLTDRVLALMVNGTPPEKILCITFTKAAAAEMANRLNRRLGEWTGLGDAALRAAIRDLDGGAVGPEKLARARRLFATVLDVPGGLKIQTVHSFCQSLLGRFPLEAGVSPRFEVMEEREAAELMRIARDTVLRAARGGGPIADALGAVTRRAQEDQFADLMRALSSERARLARALGPERDVEGAVARLADVLDVDPAGSEAAILEAACDDAAFDLMGLRGAAQRLLEDPQAKKTDQDTARLLLGWIAGGPESRVARFADHMERFLAKSKDYAPKEMKSLATKKMLEVYPDIEGILLGEQRRLQFVDQRLRRQATFEATAGLIRLGARILDAYDRAKAARARLDYDDLIVKARDLLAGDGAPPWVLFKLDGGLEHILIDEAQDTNPEQWEIVGALADEFFAGEGTAGAMPRTVFAVGDAKQSIYSFQRADPRAFQAMRHHFAARAREAGQGFRGVGFDFSFRSAEAVLRAVDATFAERPAADGVRGEDGIVRHRPQRAGHGGRVELWPLIGPGDAVEEEDAWSPPEASAIADSPGYRLAEGLAREIAGWIGAEPVPSLGRPARAGDIMVLVRHRTGFVDQLVRALKRRDVPVAGVDRMVLTEQIAVMDLLALGHFLLLPEDDLSLAAVLKSPLIGLDDDDLFRLAHARGKKSLWRRLREVAEEDPRLAEIRDWLAGHLADADRRPPFELYHDVLTRPAPAPVGPEGETVPGRRAMIARLGTEAEDPLDEFLSLALGHERSGPASLQGFLAWFARGKAEIKRDLETGQRDEVRILTVHGAKGLEAPIVVLPDSVSKPRGGQGPALRWMTVPPRPGARAGAYDAESRVLPLWTPKARYQEEHAADLKLDEDAARAQEYRRLLYVAMTRAADRLIVCGHHGATAPAEDCWYRLVQAGLERLADESILTREENWTVAADSPVAWSGERLILERPQREEVAAPEAADAARAVAAVPDWIDAPPPAEPSPPRPLAPSRPRDADPPVRSPRGSTANAVGFLSVRRGRLVHRLLQTLPDLPAGTRAEACRRFLARPSHGLSEAEVDALTAEVMGVIDAPDLAPLFAPGSRAEAPLVGLGPIDAEGGRAVVTGQVDRLAVTPAGIFVADYKTLRPPPVDPADAPIAYLRQMAHYRALLREIYPGRPIACALVWTDGPRLALLPDGLLDSVL
ncbi:double-strand break repair helicase AddA [Marivibrio halodurans]|uniref:DNA 3'-5' helicase n=1 Tax=Marivibrio halodurans TaxID=2039722 RepID=A0A8J7V5B2_9PROT|nr:double-strand break repair helicase AddA [Marivibrio halodurans]MBP5858694.1 double-strand break repair helicase AddA [Marivibrio halodurans]